MTKHPIYWVSPPCEMVARPTTADRIQRGIEKYLGDDDIIIDGEPYKVVDISINHDSDAIRAHIEAHMTQTDIKAHMTRNLHLEIEALKEGTENQRERYAAGVLPEDELTHLARAILFKGFGDLALRRWASRDRDALGRQLKHRPLCDQQPTHDPIMETCEVDELSADEWRLLTRIREMAKAAALHPWLAPDGKVEVTTSAHWATCQHCKAEAVRASAKVTIHWAGRQLVREYALWQ